MRTGSPRAGPMASGARVAFGSTSMRSTTSGMFSTMNACQTPPSTTMRAAARNMVTISCTPWLPVSRKNCRKREPCRWIT